jgi:hypothetical protein
MSKLSTVAGTVMATAPTLVLQASFEERRTAEKEDLETYERGVVHHEVEKMVKADKKNGICVFSFRLDSLF